MLVVAFKFDRLSTAAFVPAWHARSDWFVSGRSRTRLRATTATPHGTRHPALGGPWRSDAARFERSSGMLLGSLRDRRQESGRRQLANLAADHLTTARPLRPRTTQPSALKRARSGLLGLYQRRWCWCLPYKARLRPSPPQHLIERSIRQAGTLGDEPCRRRARRASQGGSQLAMREYC